MTLSTSTFTLAKGSELDRGKYRIRRLIGRGGMGAVFEAEHRGTGKVVALKCIDIERSADPECVERLAREARAACRVRHPNVVDVYDVGRDGEIMFLVMECLEGEPFSNPLERRELPIQRMIELLLPAMRGVAEAHRQGVIHRDIKPENIFLARQMDCPMPVAKVLDFGIAKLEARGHELRALTGAGRAIGTPRYMSFEQLLGEQSLDGRTDVYAFGVILYEVLTGRVPYDADTFSELLTLLAAGAPLSPEQCGAAVPAALSRIVMAAVARERDQRIASLDVLVRELEPFANQRRLEAESPGWSAATIALHPPPAAQTTSRTQTTSRSRVSTPQIPRLRGPMWLLAAAGLLVLAGLGLVLRSAPPPKLSAAAIVHPRVAVASPASLQPTAAVPPARPALPVSTVAEPEPRSVAPAPTPIEPAPLSPSPAQPRARHLDRPRDFGIY
jgi:serine/threonine protein kinase